MSKSDVKVKDRTRADREKATKKLVKVMDAAEQAEREEAAAREAFNALGARAARRKVEIDALVAAQKEDTDRLKAQVGAKVYRKFLLEAGENKFSMLTKPHRVLNKVRAAGLYGDAVKELVVTPDAVRRADLTTAQVDELYDETTAIEFAVLS